MPARGRVEDIGIIMKKTLQFLISAIVLLMLIFATGIVVNAAEISASEKEITITVGETADIIVTASDCSGRFDVFSSDPDIADFLPETIQPAPSATVSVYGAAEGSAIITVSGTEVTDALGNDVSGLSCAVSVTVTAVKEVASPAIYRGIWIALGIACVALLIIGLILFKMSRNSKDSE